MATRTQVVALLALALAVGLWLVASETAQAQSRARVVLQIDDSDSVVSPGTDVDVHIWVRSPVSGKTYSIRFFHAVGGPVVIDRGTALPSDQQPDPPSTFGTHRYIATARLAVPLGSPHGKSTLSITIDESDADETESLPLGQTTLTIGDAGDPVGSARISSAIEGFKTSGKRSSTSLRSAQTAYLKLEVKNSRGKLTDDREVKSIIITAIDGILSRRHATADADQKTSNHFIQYSDDEADEALHADALTEFTLKSLGRKPLHLDVHAFVIGIDGSVRSNTLVVNFAGKASGLIVGEPSGTLAARHGDARVVISGIDSDGNPDSLSTSQIAAEVISGPEGADLSLITVSKTSCSRSATDCETGDVVLVVRTTDKEDQQAVHGHYEMEIELEDTAEPVILTSEVVVVGEPVTISLELLDASDSAVRKIFTRSGLRNYIPGSGEAEQLIVGDAQSVIAAVTLHDEEGERISSSDRNIRGDGVTFQVAGSLSVTLLSKGEQEIVDGVAYVRFLVVGDEGSSLLLATSRDLVAHVSMVGREKARFGLDGFTRVERDNMTTWVASNTIRISELYPKLRSRRINVVYLWQFEEKRWLSYATEDGEPVPGSIDFPISYADTLWLAQ